MNVTEGSADVTSSGEGVRTLTAADIAAMVQGKLVGDPSATVRAIAPIHRAEEGDLTFLSAARYATLLASASPSVLLVSPELADTPGVVPARVVVARPQDAMLQLLPRLYRIPARVPGVHATARIGRGARIGRAVTIEAYAVLGDGVTLGDGACIGAHCVVGDGVSIGAATQLYPHVTVYAGSSLGSRVIVHAGARIGSDGFGYVFGDGRHQKIPHVGRCLVEDDVEIGANTTIDRGSIDDTVIGAGTKIDNLVQVAHNVKVGRLCLLMSQVGIAGSARIGDGCILAGQVGVGGHIEIGDRARLGGQAGVFGNVPAGESWSGYPARPHTESLRAHAALFRLSALLKRIEKLLRERE